MAARLQPRRASVPVAVLRTLSCFHLVCFSLGAPVMSLDKSAAVMAAIALPMAARFGLARAVDWLGQFDDSRYRRHLLAALGAAWAGAFVVPLDWAVWWQAWPIVSCVLAALTSSVAVVVAWLVSLRRG